MTRQFITIAFLILAPASWGSPLSSEFGLSGTIDHIFSASNSESTMSTIRVKWLPILGPFQIGPVAQYRKLQFIERAGEEESATHQYELGVGGVAKINFGDIDTDTFVPYASYEYIRSETTFSHADRKGEVVYSVPGIGILVFLNYLVALNFEINHRTAHHHTYYGVEDEQGKRLYVTESRSSKISSNFGISTFL